MYPQVSGEQRNYLEGISYSRSVNIHLGLAKKPPYPAMYIMVPKRECADITTIFLDHLKAPDRAPPGKGLISVFLRSEWCAARYGTNDEAVLSEVLDKLRMYFGDLESMVEKSVVQRWENCALMITPGIFRLMSGFKRATTAKTRVQLAGDFAQFSSVNAAIVSGERAADRIISKFGYQSGTHDLKLANQ
jgi:oxygen-dependent protoporphyrinogen oxidase